MHAKRGENKVAAKAAPSKGAKPRVKKARMSKLEAKRLENFKALMKKFGGKCTFAGSDE
jgi:hypothetical protein